MKEQRSARRYRLALPIVILPALAIKEPKPLHGRTRDISSHGIYFTLREKLSVGTEFDFSLTLPARITQNMQVVVEAKARVVRAELKLRHPKEGVDIAAQIEKYKIIEPELTTALSPGIKMA